MDRLPNPHYNRIWNINEVPTAYDLTRDFGLVNLIGIHLRKAMLSYNLEEREEHRETLSHMILDGGQVVGGEVTDNQMFVRVQWPGQSIPVYICDLPEDYHGETFESFSLDS